MFKISNSLYLYLICDWKYTSQCWPYTPESFEWQVGDWGTGGEVQVLQLWTELTEAITRAAEEKDDECFEGKVAF